MQLLQLSTTSARPHGRPLVWACQWPSSQPLSLGNNQKSQEQGLDYREGDEQSWCPSWSNSQRRGWSCGLVHCPAGKATDLIWRVLAFSQGISSWTPLKPQHSNPNSNPLANQLWCIDFLTHPTPLIIPHKLPAFLESLMPLKNRCSIQSRWSKSSLKHSIRFCGLFPSLKQDFIAYRSSKVSNCIFKLHQLWQSGFSRVYSSCCCSCWFEPEIIKIGQSSNKMYSNKILNFQESTTILNPCPKECLESYWIHHVTAILNWKATNYFIYIYIYIYIYNFERTWIIYSVTLSLSLSHTLFIFGGYSTDLEGLTIHFFQNSFFRKCKLCIILLVYKKIFESHKNIYF